MEVTFPNKFEELVDAPVSGFHINNPYLVSSMDTAEITSTLSDLSDAHYPTLAADEDKAQNAIDFLYGCVESYASLDCQYLADLARCGGEAIEGAGQGAQGQGAGQEGLGQRQRAGAAAGPELITFFKKGIYLFAHMCAKAEAEAKKIANTTGAGAKKGKKAGSVATAATVLLEALLHQEHFPAQAADLLAAAQARAQQQGGLIIAEIMSEIGRMGFAHMPAAGVRNVASFIEAFAKTAPNSMIDAFPVL
ncbi:hypothetical protein B484DRAFT_402981, partial [Ochromonadaceae sp. CCMP2298]